MDFFGLPGWGLTGRPKSDVLLDIPFFLRFRLLKVVSLAPRFNMMEEEG